MLPRAPVLWLELDAGRAAGLAPAATTLDAVAPDDGALRALDHEAFGREREVDTQHWADDTAAEPYVLHRGGWPVAYAWLRPRRRPSARTRRAGRSARPAAGRRRAAADALLAAVALAAGRGRRVALNVVGPHPALLALLGAGARVVDRDIWLASLPVFDPARYVPSLLHG